MTLPVVAILCDTHALQDCGPLVMNNLITETVTQATTQPGRERQVTLDGLIHHMCTLHPSTVATPIRGCHHLDTPPTARLSTPSGSIYVRTLFVTLGPYHLSCFKLTILKNFLVIFFFHFFVNCF